MCLSHSAHGVVPNHAIFQGPFDVDLSLENTDVPDNYARIWSGLVAGSALPTWRVDRESYIDNAAMAPGVVSSGWGFTDSPDAEVIASGLNSKGPNAVALGRQGPFFHWGFAGSPSQMTEAGRHAFLNSIVYIDAFDGAPLLVRRNARAREEIFDYLHHAGGPDGASLFDVLFPPDLVTRYGTDSAAPYAAYYAENMEYLVFDEETRTFNTDPDARALGIPNRSVAMLDLAIKDLRGGSKEEKARAQRILLRYTTQELEGPEAWSEWLGAVRADLFFSDVGGFRFRVNESALDPMESARAAHLALELSAREDWQRLVADVHLSETAVAPGATIKLTVRLSISPGWHAYAELPETSPYRRTALELSLPDGIEAIGPWSLPPTSPSSTEPGGTQYSGDAVFVRALKVGPGAEGKLTLPVALSYQVCDRDSCLRPTTETLEAVLEIQR